jgi:DNA-binding MarR family transcriptional regulator
MSEFELDRSLGFLLHDVSRLLRKRFDQRAKSLGLTRAQYHLLAHLARNEGINQAGLAEILEIEPITLTRLVDRMEAGAWLERRADPLDRRARTLFLTDKARAVFRRMRMIASGLHDEALRGFTAEERERLLDDLVRARSNLTDPTATGAPDGEGVPPGMTASPRSIGRPG